MGLFDVNNHQEVNIKNPVVIKPTKNGGIIVCPECNGEGRDYFPDYGSYGNTCHKCKGGGAIEVRVIK